MKYISFFSFLIFCFQDCGSCDLDPESCIVKYKFEVPIGINPSNDTMRIGDTLWISSIISTELNDLNSNESIDISEFDFHLESIVNKMDTIGAPNAELDFDWVSEIGTHRIITSGPHYISAYDYEFFQNDKRLKIGMVCKKEGLFKLAFFYLTNNLLNVELTDSKCVQNIDLQNILDNGNDNNYHLLLNNPNPVSSLEDFKKYAAYAFVVVK